jgi:cobalamin synthase
LRFPGAGRCVTAEITARHCEIGAQSLLTILFLTPTAIVLAGVIRKSATMNSLSADHPPSNSNGSLTAPVVNDLRNPLWIIAIGMACFFGTALVVMALSWN